METKKKRKKYSWLGFSYFIFVLMYEAASVALSLILSDYKDSLRENSWAVYALGLLPIWAIGFPICILFLTRIQSEKPEVHDIRPKYMAQFYFITVCFMFATNIMGTIVISILQSITGLTIENSTIDLINKQELLPSILFAVIVGPICEELAFRKFIIDKVGQYNKRYAIYLSAIMFGLFHTNLHQFFYATAIGIVFGYIYTISGKIRYSIILHMLVNLFSGIVPMAIMKHIDLSVLDSISSGNLNDPATLDKAMEIYSNPAFILLLVYFLVEIAFAILGLVFFILNVKRMKVNDSQSPLPIKGAGKVVFVNVGVILFTILIIGLTILEIIALQ